MRDTNGPTFEASVLETEPGRPALLQSTTGGAKATAAWLRALADEIDPPRTVTRERANEPRSRRSETF